MKHVVSESGVAHLWANKLQDDARNAQSNFKFSGDTIFSYGSHFPIAKHIEYKGKSAVLFTERKWSQTTSGHIQITRNAANHLNIIHCYEVDFSEYSANSFHKDNFYQWEREGERLLKKLASARKPEIYVSELRSIANRVKKYAEFFDVPVPESLLETLSVKDKTGLGKHEENLAVLAEKARLLYIATKKKEVRKQKARHKKELKEFREFKRAYLTIRDEYDYIRYNPQTDRIETSQRVEIPLAIAKRFYFWLLGKVKTGGCTDCNFTIMDYRVKIVTGDAFKVGCHHITLKEVNNVYASLPLEMEGKELVL